MVSNALGVFEKIQNFFFLQKTPKTVLLITKQPNIAQTEAVLYSKRTAGYPLSPHIKTIVVVLLRAE